jgi:hypothetical protein
MTIEVRKAGNEDDERKDKRTIADVTVTNDLALPRLKVSTRASRKERGEEDDERSVPLARPPSQQP